MAITPPMNRTEVVSMREYMKISRDLHPDIDVVIRMNRELPASLHKDPTAKEAHRLYWQVMETK